MPVFSYHHTPNFSLFSLSSSYIHRLKNERRQEQQEEVEQGQQRRLQGQSQGGPVPLHNNPKGNNIIRGDDPQTRTSDQSVPGTDPPSSS